MEPGAQQIKFQHFKCLRESTSMRDLQPNLLSTVVFNEPVSTHDEAVTRLAQLPDHADAEAVLVIVREVVQREAQRRVQSNMANWKTTDPGNRQVNIACAVAFASTVFGRAYVRGEHIPPEFAKSYIQYVFGPDSPVHETKEHYTRQLVVSVRDPWDQKHFPDGRYYPRRQKPFQPVHDPTGITGDVLKAMADMHGFVVVFVDTGIVHGLNLANPAVPKVVMIAYREERAAYLTLERLYRVKSP